MKPNFQSIFCHAAFVAKHNERPYAKVRGEFSVAPVAHHTEDGTIAPAGDVYGWAFCLPQGTHIVVPRRAADGKFLGGTIFQRGAGESVVFIDYFTAEHFSKPQHQQQA